MKSFVRNIMFLGNGVLLQASLITYEKKPSLGLIKI